MLVLSERLNIRPARPARPVYDPVQHFLRERRERAQDRARQQKIITGIFPVVPLMLLAVTKASEVLLFLKERKEETEG